ncbi:MAG: pyridoxamine 5'-phosphate oxidase family protein [Candidatus Bathyarchaeota archaeon]|nr:pyridoxamine 5'-phosphate oxidase family protein [Candidatus Bathyarchaeota archaeon]
MAERTLLRMKKDEIEKLIKEQFLCRIAFRGEEYPYIAPFQYVFMNETLYFHFTAHGRKMRLVEKDKQVCVEIEKYKPDLSQYVFVTLKGKLSIVTDPLERAEVVKNMRELGKEKLSKNFLVAHGFAANGNWDSFTAEKPLLIIKLEHPVEESGLKSPQ